METLKRLFQNKTMLAAVVFLGLAARLAVASMGYNYDMKSWFAVAEIMRHGGNVYAETPRYNYGPAWFLVLHVLDLIAAHQQQILRWLIAVFLSAVDAGIFLVLCRRAGGLAGALFFLNPISILITGYHCQFDNLAILLGLGGVLAFGDDFAGPLDRRKIGGLLLLGLSLVTKHLLFLFPLWLAVKQPGLGKKLVVLLLPAACFFLSLAPYWPGGHAGIVENVFLYQSSGTSFAYRYCLPAVVQFLGSSRAVWLGVLVLGAFVCRPRNGFHSLLVYTGVMVAFAPATVNQYLAIPVALAAVFPSLPFLLYTAFGTLQIISDTRNGPRFSSALHGRYDDLAIYALVCALLWLYGRAHFLRLFQQVRREIEIQLGRG